MRNRPVSLWQRTTGSKTWRNARPYSYMWGRCTFLTATKLLTSRYIGWGTPCVSNSDYRSSCHLANWVLERGEDKGAREISLVLREASWSWSPPFWQTLSGRHNLDGARAMRHWERKITRNCKAGWRPHDQELPLSLSDCEEQPEKRTNADIKQEQQDIFDDSEPQDPQVCPGIDWLCEGRWLRKVARD